MHTPRRPWNQRGGCPGSQGCEILPPSLGKEKENVYIFCCCYCLHLCLKSFTSHPGKRKFVHIFVIVFIYIRTLSCLPVWEKKRNFVYIYAIVIVYICFYNNNYLYYIIVYIFVFNLNLASH